MAKTTILVHPVPTLRDGRQPHITSSYGPRVGGMYEFHYGVDILFPRGPEPAGRPWTSASGSWSMPDDIPALAAADGVVSRSSWTGTGDRVRIDHDDTWSTSYMHLRSRLVNSGDRVRAGQPIGTISFNPWKRGAPHPALPGKPNAIGLNHLHFEVSRDGTQVDPEDVLGDQLGELQRLPNPWDVSGRALALVAMGLAAAGIYQLTKKS